MEEYETDYENICKPLALGLVMFPGHWNISEATNLCKNVRGEINVIRDANNNEEVRALMKKSDICKNSGNNKSFQIHFDSVIQLSFEKHTYSIINITII